MPEFTSYDPGTPCWIDLMSPDPVASEAFYTAVFGWEAERQIEEGQHIYTMLRLDGRDVAGLGGQPPDAGEMPAAWNSYVAVTDCAATAAAIESAGGSVIMPPMQVMEAGEMGIFTDPTGAAFSIWKPGEHIGAGVANEPNTWSWNELMTRDVDAAKAFYAEVFGWTYQTNDMPTGDAYTLIEGGTDDQGMGGIMAMPADMPDMVPNHWGVYFTVTDLAAAVAAVRENGGNPVMEPIAMEGVGTFVTVHDPLGASFSLMQPEAA